MDGARNIGFATPKAVEWSNEGLRQTAGAATGNQIGAIFGSTLGQSIAGDNVFAQIGVSTVLGTALGNIGEAIGIFADTAADWMTSAQAAFDDFSTNLFDNLRGQSASAISSFLVAEFSARLAVCSRRDRP